MSHLYARAAAVYHSAAGDAGPFIVFGGRKVLRGGSAFLTLVSVGGYGFLPIFSAPSGGTMQLREFIAEAITQITRGITDAQTELATEWVRINPKPPEGAAPAGAMIYTAENGAAVFPLSFDVAVTADDRRGDVGVGIKVLGFGLDVKDGSSESRSTVSRVSFTIPIAYPLKRIGSDSPPG